jgi:hypothetical protein
MRQPGSGRAGPAGPRRGGPCGCRSREPAAVGGSSMRSSPKVWAGCVRQAVGDGQDTHGAAQLNAPIGSRPRHLEALACAPTRRSTVQAQGNPCQSYRGSDQRADAHDRHHRLSVVPGGHRPLPLEPVDPALDRMPQPVDHRIEGRRPATMATLARRLAAWSSFSGMVARMPRQRSSARLAREL